MKFIKIMSLVVGMFTVSFIFGLLIGVPIDMIEYNIKEKKEQKRKRSSDKKKKDEDDGIIYI